MLFVLEITVIRPQIQPAVGCIALATPTFEHFSLPAATNLFLPSFYILEVQPDHLKGDVFIVVNSLCTVYTNKRSC